MSFLGIKSRKEREEARLAAEEAKEVQRREAEAAAAKAKQEALVRAERRVYAALTLYRMNRDLAAVDAEMEKKRPKDTESTDFLTKAFNDGVMNPINRLQTKGLSDEKQAILDRIFGFEKKCADEGIDLTECRETEEVKTAVRTFFEDDKQGFGRVVFALRFALDESVEYYDAQQTLADVSELLFEDRARIRELVCDLKENYACIGRTAPFGTFGSGLLVGLGAMSIFAVAGAPLIAMLGAAGGMLDATCALSFGAWAPVFTAAGVSLSVQSTAIASIAILGTAALGRGAVRLSLDESAKAALRSLDTSEYQTLFALKATLVKYAKRTLPEEKFKDILDEHLRDADEVRADAEYVMVVEKLDAKRSGEKIRIANNFVDRLGAIVGI